MTPDHSSSHEQTDLSPPTLTNRMRLLVAGLAAVPAIVGAGIGWGVGGHQEYVVTPQLLKHGEAIAKQLPTDCALNLYLQPQDAKTTPDCPPSYRESDLNIANIFLHHEADGGTVFKNEQEGRERSKLEAAGVGAGIGFAIGGTIGLRKWRAYNQDYVEWSRKAIRQ